jgi:hypothetical protein
MRLFLAARRFTLCFLEENVGQVTAGRALLVVGVWAANARPVAHARIDSTLQDRKTARQLDLKETVRWQIRSGDIRKHGATGGVPMTT